MKSKMRKCGYARVSTLAEEQEHSLVSQTEYYKELIKNEPNSIFVGIYADRKSGKNTRQRPQFMEMIKAAKRGEIDYIITKSIARFARNLVETLRIIRELRAINVGVYFEKEKINTLDTASDFMISLYSIIAESELTSMSENVKWAARKRYQNGSVELNSNLYGYTLQDGQLTPVPDEAEIVKEIYKRYAGGEGYAKIARDLNERRVKKKIADTLWNGNDVKRILENEKYVGDALLQKSYKKNFKPVREKVIEEEFVKALNGLVKNRDEVVKVVGESVNRALAETGEDIDKSDELREIDDTIETLQGQILEINKQRVRREIDQEKYNNDSRKVMAKLDVLFVERDKILSEQKTATLSKAFQAVVAEFISKAGEQAEFDKDIFTRLVDKICIKGREKIVFVMKDGTEMKRVL